MADKKELGPKRECSTCQNIAPGCKKATMGNWKSRIRPGGKRTKCGDCKIRHLK